MIAFISWNIHNTSISEYLMIIFFSLRVNEWNNTFIRKVMCNTEKEKRYNYYPKR